LIGVPVKLIGQSGGVPSGSAGSRWRKVCSI